MGKIGMADDIYKAIEKAEAFTEEWIIILIDRSGQRSYWDGRKSTRFRGNARRFDGEAAALEGAHRLRTETSFRGGQGLAYPWIKDTEVERVK